MTKQKSFFQKAVEKTLLLERNEQFSLILSEDQFAYGDDALILGLADDDGSIFPIAKLLSKTDIDALVPNFDTLEPLTDLKVSAGKEILGSHPDDMLDTYLDSLADDAVDSIKANGATGEQQ